MSTVLKDCKTCGHRSFNVIGGWMVGGKCGLSGYHCTTERSHPTPCGEDYTGWVPLPDSALTKVLKSIAKGLKKVFIIEVKDDKR